MRKKFLKVMLFGALTLSATASFVGCKDYDDDVDGLKTSIDATNADLASKAAALEASIGSLKSAQTDLTAAIAKAKEDAEKAALTAKEQAIASSLATMTQIKEELNALIAANTGDIVTLNAKAKEAETKLNALEGQLTAIQQMLGGYAELVETVGKLQSAISRIDDVASSLELLTVQVEKAISDIAAQKTTLEAQKNAITALEELTGKQAEDMVTVKEDLATLLNKVNEMETALAQAPTKEDLNNVQNGIDANKTSISNLSAKIDGQLNILKSLFRSMITNINLVEGAESLRLLTAYIPGGQEFGKGIEGGFKFVEGTYTSASTIKIQVSPSTANISKEMLAFVRSDGESLSSDLISIEVKPYNEALTTRGESKGGIWEVSVKLNPTYDKATFDKLVSKQSRPYRFAVAIKDAATEVEGGERIIASPYDLTFVGSTNYTAMTTLTTTINDNVFSDHSSNPVEIGTPIKVKVKGNYEGVYASYITLNTSNPATLALWEKTFGVTGHGKVSMDNEFTLNVANDVADGQQIHFKLWTVDFLGTTTLDRVFNLVCGKKNTGNPELKVTLTPAIYVGGNYDMPKAVALTSALATTDADAKNLVGGYFDVEFKDANGATIINPYATLYKKDGTTLVNISSANFETIKEIAAVRLTNIDLKQIADNGSLVGKLIFKNANSLEVMTVPVTLNKVMPGFPAAFSAKSGMLVDGVIKVYPTYKGTKATYAYSKIFNGLNESGNPYYTFGYKIKDAEVNEGNKVNFDNAPAATYTEIGVDNKLVGGQYKAIPIEVKYNYGFISSEKKNNQYVPYNYIWTVPAALKFASIPEDSKLTVKAFDIAYPVATHKVAAADIVYTNIVDQTKFNLATMPNIANIVMKTVSVGNGTENEYYIPKLVRADSGAGITPVVKEGDIIFEKSSDHAALNSDVASKLVITITDVFGNKSVREFTFKVKANQAN